MSDVATVITRDEATTRLARVRDAVGRIWDDLIALYAGRAWFALGYESWDAMCDGELDGARIALPREDRREVVGQMREAGMSTRAIASAIGTSDITVRRDLTATDVAVDEVQSLDGRVRPAKVTTTSRTTEATKVEQHVDTDTGEVLDGPTLAGRAAADAAPLPPLPRIPRSDAEWERHRIGKQNGWIARALKYLDGMQDPQVRARLIREWDPTNCDENPETVDPELMTAIAGGLLAFAKELKGRHVRVI